MKLTDVVGFASILSAGYYWGSHPTQTGTDWLIIGALLALGFYFAVILS